MQAALTIFSGSSNSRRGEDYPTMSAGPLHTPLHAWHAAHGGRMVEFGGWHMPVQYTAGIVAEHHATRRSIGLFDVSHMGRVRFTGPAATAFLNAVVTKDVTTIKPGQIRYALVTNEAGGVLDDVLVYRLPGNVDDPEYQVVINASNRLKILAHFAEQLKAFPHVSGVHWTDLTSDLAMIAVQGPRALELVQPLIDFPLLKLKYYNCRAAKLWQEMALVSRTGYTGEDGVELILPSAAAPSLWEALVNQCADWGGLPAGLGCRDTLRLEAAMPLYSHELNEELNPLQVGLGFAVDLKKPDFCGREALLKAKADATLPIRVGLELGGKRIPRQDFGIFATPTSTEKIGWISSGTFSPTLERVIAMAFVPAANAAIGSTVLVDIRGQREPARVVPLPFYKRKA